MRQNSTETHGMVQAASQSSKLSVQMYPWGYGLRLREKAGFWALLAQALSGGTAIVCFSVAVGLWVLPGSNVGLETAAFKMVFTGILSMMGLLALWFATQGTKYELQVDRTRRELREVLRNKKGQEFLLRKFAFEEMSSVIFARDPARNMPGFASLMLRHKTQTHSLELVHDKEERLRDLRALLARDILSENPQPTREDASFDAADLGHGMFGPRGSIARTATGR
jgi:hypothetical protein